jgi:xanthine dehydrogenase accessory factor
MSGWVTQLSKLAGDGTPTVLVSVAEAAGSTPRTAGTRMVVTADDAQGTIGGGTLEHRAIQAARAMLESGALVQREPVALGPQLGQCCGGRVALHYEVITEIPSWLGLLHDSLAVDEPVVLVTDTAAPRRLAVTAASAAGDPALETSAVVTQARRLLLGGVPESEDGLVYEMERAPALRIALFGAGHVGRALAAVLSTLPGQLTWIDSRPDQFPDPLPGGVNQIVPDEPADVIDDLLSGTHILIMTHSHGLDLELVEGALRKGDFASLGLIGSATKRAQFEKRLRARGFTDAHLARLICPIGIDGITGKAPGEIAVAAAAQVLQCHEARGETKLATHGKEASA